MVLTKKKNILLAMVIMVGLTIIFGLEGAPIMLDQEIN